MVRTQEVVDQDVSEPSLDAIVPTSHITGVEVLPIRAPTPITTNARSGMYFSVNQKTPRKKLGGEMHGTGHIALVVLLKVSGGQSKPVAST